MLILTNENNTFDLNLIGNRLATDVRYGVFDFSDKQNADYFFRPLFMYESFNMSAFEVMIGDYKILVPAEWSIVLGDKESGDIEIVPLEDINERDFKALVYNPIGKSSWPKFEKLKITDLYLDIRWAVPRLGVHNFLMAPLHKGPNPECIMLINEKDQKKVPTLELDIFLA